VTDKEKAAL